jgi:SAM-dependent methyltransferase
MLADRTRWNAKYREGGMPSEPAAIVREFCGLAPGRAALDLAAGNGRNALFLAGRGFRVDAVDISDAGLELFGAGRRGIRRICADLDTFDLARGRYDLILNILYLNRRLFPQIIEGLKPGGVLIFESLLETAGRADKGQGRRDYTLRPNELLHAFLELEVRYYRETPAGGRRGDKALASLVAVRRPFGARRPSRVDSPSGIT